MLLDATNPGPQIWIISTGTEILQGHSPDRNAQWLSGRLLELGLSVARHMALPDDKMALKAAIAQAAREADLIITTGGLGPTVDDLNRFVFSEIWQSPLEEHAESVERIEERFSKRGRTMPASNKIQAMIPANAVVLANDNGTAPGFYLKPHSWDVRATLIALPGPPREMTLMFEQQAQALLLRDFGAHRRPLRTLTFHTLGLPESYINECVKDIYNVDPLVNLAMLAKMGQVDIRLTLRGYDDESNRSLEEKWRGWIRERICQDAIYGEETQTLTAVVAGLLRQRGQTVATAESCTGGKLAARLTDLPGSSMFMREGFVTYSNEAKNARLGVPSVLIDRHGAVSPETATAMAVGARRAAVSDWAVSITGIAGPDGGTEEKPVGLVYFGLATPDGKTRTVQQNFLGDRDDIRRQATFMALDILRRGLLGYALQPVYK